MAYLIDTNIAFHARDGNRSVLAKLAEQDGAVVLSALSLAELQRGLFKSPALTASRLVRLEILLHSLPVLPFDGTAAETYGRIVATCGWVKVRDFDRMIAAHAISTNSVLVTNNIADFQDIPGLSIEDWAT